MHLLYSVQPPCIFQGNAKTWNIDIIVERLAFFDRKRCYECVKDADTDPEDLKPVLVVKKMEYFSSGSDFPTRRDDIIGRLQEELKSQFLWVAVRTVAQCVIELCLLQGL